MKTLYNPFGNQKPGDTYLLIVNREPIAEFDTYEELEQYVVRNKLTRITVVPPDENRKYSLAEMKHFWNRLQSPM